LSDAASQRQAAREVILRSLSVRETEALVKKLTSPPSVRQSSQAPPGDVHTRAAEDRLRFALGTKVRIVRGPSGTGTIEISFGSESELNRLYAQLLETTRTQPS
jgi:ParB family chromosome partitioning protein